MLALSHNPITSVTNIFIHGVRKREGGSIIDQIRESSLLWLHPMLLPTIIFHVHLKNTERYRVSLNEKVVAVEYMVGYVDVGQLSWTYAGSGLRENKVLDLEQLTTRLHSYLTELIFLDQVSRFRIDCASFLVKTIKEIQDLYPESTRQVRAWEARELEQSIDYMKSMSDTLWYQTYSMIAQNDSRLNYSIASDSAQIAVASKRDSSAMKTVALITVLFLPGTFVAAIFSMSMFDWQPSSGQATNTTTTPSRRPSVSPFLWIYWAITIPFTFIVLAAWRIWWILEDKKYAREIRDSTKEHGSSRLLAKSQSSLQMDAAARDGTAEGETLTKSLGLNMNLNRFPTMDTVMGVTRRSRKKEREQDGGEEDLAQIMNLQV
ncbi:hypothetical protein MMC24_001425 [Lignoscripta atroalba]|nr:hypothetical protein [Lignoscripta atroalba]